MIQNLKTRKWALAVLSILSIWIIVALYLSFAALFMASQDGYTLSIPESILFEIICISPWAISTPFVIWLARRYNFSKPYIWNSLCFHFLAALAVFIFHCLIQSYAVSLFFDDIDFIWGYIKRDFTGFLEMRILLYTGLLLGVHTFDFYQKNKDSILQEPLIRAELNKLSFQEMLNHLQPEFLISSIDIIKQEIKTSPQQAEKNLNEVSTLLRMMLHNISSEESTIQEDHELIDLYLDITQKRLGINIKSIYDIEPACYDACIPNFLFIMPFMEALVKFDQHTRKNLKSFTTKGRVENGTLFLEGIIEEIELTNQDLITINKNVKMGEILTRLHARFGDDVQLRTSLENRKIHIHLSLPYKKHKENTFTPYNKLFGDATYTKP